MNQRPRDSVGPLTRAATDEQAKRAWDRIARLARDHQLIVQAAGGVMTLAMPDEQRKAGIREQVLRTHRACEGA